MINLHGIPSTGVAVIPPAAFDLDAVKAALTLSATEDFNGSTLNSSRWRILGEPGMSQSSALAPVISWGDHYGQVSDVNSTPNYIHDPAKVSLADSVLRLGWSYSGGVWGAGGITSATSWGAPRGTLFNLPTRGLIEVKFRVPVLPLNSSAFYAAWALPRDDSYGIWPSSGERDFFEGTQHRDGVVVNGSGNHAYANLPNDWGINFAGNSSVLTSPAISMLDGQWHVISVYQHPEGSEEVIDHYLDGRHFHQMRVPAAYADRVRAPHVWILNAQGPGFWGVGVPANADLASYVFEIDWVKHWVVTTPPPPASKPTAAPVLQAKGLSLIWQDRLGEADAPTSFQNFMNPYPSSRYHHCDFSPQVCDLRVTPVTYDGKACLRDRFSAGSPGILNYRSQYLPNTYSQLGICWDVFYPSGWNLRNQQGGAIHGKTLFGMICGHGDFHKPGVASYPRGWAGEVREVKDVWGAMCGLNWRYDPRKPTKTLLHWYPHLVGAYVGGQDRLRSGLYSNPSDVPGYPEPARYELSHGVWHRLELYGKMDTNRRNGVLELWVDGVLVQALNNLDLGGWVGNRGITSGAGQLVGANGGGWRWRGVACRSMIGGYTLATDLIPQYGGSSYVYNLRVYGAT